MPRRRPTTDRPLAPFESTRSVLFRGFRFSWDDAGNGSRRQRGFTLLELLVVIAILGLLLAFVGPRVMTLFGGAKQKIAQQSITQIEDILEFYRLDVGAYPTTEQGLQSLVSAPPGVPNWRGPYIKDSNVPLDPWGKPFQYRSPSARGGQPFDIYTLGADAQPGGSGENADILND